jgi:hypothetical protein
MSNTKGAGHPRLSAEQAFVVHLFETDSNHGRIEHVSSGRCMRFDSVAALIGFMRETLALSAASPNGAEFTVPVPSATDREGNV